MPKPKPKFYLFHQNNSGGFYNDPAINVIVEADSPEEANELAEEIGLYFDDGEADCECCGQRWYEQYSSEDGYDVPSLYGTPLDDYTSEWSLGGLKFPEVAVYYKSGKVETFNLVKNKLRRV